jgi:hypothetical protein
MFLFSVFVGLQRDILAGDAEGKAEAANLDEAKAANFACRDIEHVFSPVGCRGRSPGD